MSTGYDVGMAADDEDTPPAPPLGVAFLLAQLGNHATRLFAERVSALDLTPAQAGLLRSLGTSPGRSQRQIADDLGMPPSRFVPLADELEARGLIERRKNPTDRRLHALHLTDSGTELLARLRTVGKAHEQHVCAALTPAEHGQLLALLRRIADQQHLTPGVHPGYRTT
jgi:DNA-binding MarR family transcriptional regulator